MGHGAWGGSSSGGYKPGNFNFDDLFKDFDDDFFRDLRGHFAQHFGNHKMAHESTGGHFDFADINIEKFFKKPNGFDESDLLYSGGGGDCSHCDGGWNGGDGESDTKDHSGGHGTGEDIMTYNLTTWTLAPGAGEEG